MPVDEVVEDVLLGPEELVWKFIRIRHDLEERVSLDRKVLAKGDVEWIQCRFICHNAVVEYEPTGSRSGRQSIEPLTRDRIEDNTRASATGGRVTRSGRFSSSVTMT